MAADLMKDVKKYLVSRTASTPIPIAVTATLGFGKNLFIGREPASPLNCITLYPTGGSAPEVVRLAQNPTFQVRIRNINWAKGYAIGNAIVKDFHMNTTVCASSHGKLFAMQSEPIPIGVNDNDTANLFTINFAVKHTRF